jgi:hypothetical protein
MFLRPVINRDLIAMAQKIIDYAGPHDAGSDKADFHHTHPFMQMFTHILPASR